jgi:hypothetical protein
MSQKMLSMEKLFYCMRGCPIDEGLAKIDQS